jgi:hypothetical protein
VEYRLKRIFAAAAALMIAAPAGTLHALVPADAGTQQTEPPKDCKMKPEDPRCKDQKD